jgi:hypothetical protein
MKRLLLAASAALALIGCQTSPPPEQAARSMTVNIQGGPAETQPWRDSAGMHEFYALSVETLTKGKPVDRADYEAKSRDIFRRFAIAMGMPPEGMLDHLKLIPGQVIQIYRDDPKSLASYANFWVAMVGPD